MKPSATIDDDFLRRYRFLVSFKGEHNEFKGTDREAAEFGDCNPRQISRHKNGLAAPSLQIAGKIADRKGVSLDWLFSGQGEVFFNRKNRSPNSDLEYVQGPGFEMAFDKSTWERIGSESLSVCFAKNDDMAGLIKKGDVVFYDEAKKDVSPGVYVIEVDKSELIARTGVVPGKVKFLFDNAEKKNFSVPRDELGQVKILGSVVCVIKILPR